MNEQTEPRTSSQSSWKDSYKNSGHPHDRPNPILLQHTEQQSPSPNHISAPTKPHGRWSQTSENHCPETIQEQITNQSILPLHARTLGSLGTLHCCVINNSCRVQQYATSPLCFKWQHLKKKQGPRYIHQSMQPFVELLKALVGRTVFLSPTTLYAHGASRSNACST